MIEDFIHDIRVVSRFFLIGMFLVFAMHTNAQVNIEKNPPGFPLEKQEGKYSPSPRELHPRSPAYRYEAPGFSIVQVNVDENGNNIMNDAANEPSMACDPDHPEEIVFGWRQFDNINDAFRQAGYAYSNDAGQNWTFPGVIDPGVFRSDPVLGHDGNGNFYYNSLTTVTGDYTTNVYKSSDGGQSWEMGTFARGGDKQWMSIDKSDGIGGGNIYEFWNGVYSVCTPNNFTRSTDDNFSYEACSTIPGNPRWGTSFIDPDGNLYICGALDWSGFMFAKSSTAKDPQDNVSWDWTVGVNLDGEIVGIALTDVPNPEGLLGQTIITMDSTGGPGHGNIYMLCSVDRLSTPDPCDVMFASSSDGGLTWSNPVRVNDDTGFGFQWFGTMSVAPDGRIDVVWLDDRESFGTFNSALYYSYSLDQGQTWEPNVKLSETFDPQIGWPGNPPQRKMGDYFDMYSDEAGAHLAWSATFNGEQDVYYSVIAPDYMGITEQQKNIGIRRLSNFPNPAGDRMNIRYDLEHSGIVTIKVYTMNGQEMSNPVDGFRGKGMNIEEINVAGLKSGIYYYRIQTGDELATRRFIVLNNN